MWLNNWTYWKWFINIPFNVKLQKQYFTPFLPYQQQILGRKFLKFTVGNPTRHKASRTQRCRGKSSLALWFAHFNEWIRIKQRNSSCSFICNDYIPVEYLPVRANDNSVNIKEGCRCEGPGGVKRHISGRINWILEPFCRQFMLRNAKPRLFYISVSSYLMASVNYIRWADRSLRICYPFV